MKTADAQNIRQAFQAVDGRLDKLGLNSLSVGGVWQRGSAAMAYNKAALADIVAQAVEQKRPIQIPGGEWFCDAGTQILNGLVPIICNGRVYTNAKVPFITMQAVGGAGAVADNFWIEGGEFFNLDGTQAQKGSSIIKFLSDGALILYPEFIDVEGHGFYQMFDNAAGSRVTPFGKEGTMNHGKVDGCVPHWYGALNAKSCIRHRTGSGTGWLYDNCRDNMAVGASPDGADPDGTEVTGYPAYVRIEGGAGFVVSDILIGGQMSGLRSHFISVDGNMIYNSNLAVDPTSQVDAQADGTIFYDPPLPAPSQPAINLTVAPANVGGNIDIAPNARVVGSRIHAQGFGHATGGNYVNLGAGAVVQPICSVEMQAGHTCEVTVQASGAVNGVASGGRKKVFTVRHDGAVVTSTEQAGLGWKDPSGGGAGFFDFTAVVAGSTVTFNLTMNAASGGNIVAVQYEVKGGAWRTRRLF